MIPNNLFEMMRAMPVFKPEMRKANRDGLKSKTRRVVTLKNEYGLPLHYSRIVDHPCPYGRAGDYCYMREPLYHGFGGVAYYRDDLTIVRHALTGEPITWRWKKDVLTSIFMPKEAARFVYRYESIRVERVQEMPYPYHDVFSEGLRPVWHGETTGKTGAYEKWLLEQYKELWNEINEKRGYGWDVNPWVWVLEYKPVGVSNG